LIEPLIAFNSPVKPSTWKFGVAVVVSNSIVIGSLYTIPLGGVNIPKEGYKSLEESFKYASYVGIIYVVSS